MSREDGIITTTLRLNTNTPEGWKAYSFLHNSRKEKKCRSYSELITEILAACYDREQQKQRDAYLESREKEDAFVAWIKEIITKAIQEAQANSILNFVQLIRINDGNAMDSIPVPRIPKQESKPEDHAQESFDLSMDFINGWDADISGNEPDAD